METKVFEARCQALVNTTDLVNVPKPEPKYDDQFIVFPIAFAVAAFTQNVIVYVFPIVVGVFTPYAIPSRTFISLFLWQRIQFVFGRLPPPYLISLTIAEFGKCAFPFHIVGKPDNEIETLSSNHTLS